MENSHACIASRAVSAAKILMEETNLEVLEKVMQDSNKYGLYKPVEKAAWWKTAIERLEKEVGKEKIIKIMELCGRKCCGPTHRKQAKQLMSESKSIEEFLGKLNKSWPAGVRFELKDKDTIVQVYERCFCGQVKQTKEPFPTNTYCQCGVGWVKQLFESALEKPVEIELIQSIISGAGSCKFIIHI
jgi:predicted hydrocarbon binding protein